MFSGLIFDYFKKLFLMLVQLQVKIFITSRGFASIVFFDAQTYKIKTKIPITKSIIN